MQLESGKSVIEVEDSTNQYIVTALPSSGDIKPNIIRDGEVGVVKYEDDLSKTVEHGFVGEIFTVDEITNVKQLQEPEFHRQ